MKHIGIIGCRSRDTSDDYELVRLAFLKIAKPGDIIVSGGCERGGDRFAEILAERFKLENIIHLPDKSQLDPGLLKKNRRAAYAVINYARNTLIARDSDVLIACVAPDRKGGTEDTIRKYKAMGKTELVEV